MNLPQTVVDVFNSSFGNSPSHLARSPGRVNLIGEHTDYNDGYVLPMAINREMLIAFQPRHDGRVVVDSLDVEGRLDFHLTDFSKTAHAWGEYIKGVAWALQEKGYTLHGWQGVLAGDVPIGAGLSSSAALELAAARVFSLVSGFSWQPAEMALIGQKAENGWVGMNCGIMDQMISAVGEQDHALLIDCRTLQTEAVPLPQDKMVVILDTNTRRGLVDSAYNERRAQCEAVARHFAVPALRDVSLQQLQTQQSELDSISYRRALHVVSENQRVLQAVAALRTQDSSEFGRLMCDSHRSMRDDFEISRKEMDCMVTIAQTQPGCDGARMTGGGFGGCAVALVDQQQVDEFVENVSLLYQQQTGLQAEVYISRPAAGTSYQIL